MTALEAKYRAKAEAAFAKRDAQRCPPDPEARFLLGLLTEQLDQWRASNTALLSRPYLLPTERMHASDALRQAAAGTAEGERS